MFERLVRLECDSASGTLCNAAQVRQDDRVLLEIMDQDLWAKDILYHASCYANYVSPRALQFKLKREVAAEDTSDSAHARDRAFSSLVDLVTETIITCPMTVTNLKDLCSRYVEFLRREGVEEVSYPSYCPSRHGLCRILEMP